MALDFKTGIHLVAGPNAQGKTNLIEAIHLVSTGKLLRTKRDAEAIRHGSDSATVQATVGETDSEIEIQLASGKRKRVTVNSASLSRPSDLLGRLPTVSFSAVDLEIVRGEPSERRLFLDLALSQISPAYLQHLARYKRALDQRNALLRQASDAPIPNEVFEVWEDEMGRHGVALRLHRASFVQELAVAARELDETLADGEELCLAYRAQDAGDTEDALTRGLAEGRRADILRGTSQIGPHRDEMDVMIDGQLARSYGSQGQQRSAAIALKLGVLALTRAKLPVEPALLLDDVFSDLDQSRRKNLITIGSRLAGQVILTCTEAEQAGSEMLKTATVFMVREGTIKRA